MRGRSYGPEPGFSVTCTLPGRVSLEFKMTNAKNGGWMGVFTGRTPTGAVARPGSGPRRRAPLRPNQREMLSERTFYTGVNGHSSGSSTITVTKTTTVNGNPSLR